MKLYRPVGSAELSLIENSGFSAFPPRLPEQPIFYPVLSLDYARQIASQWNTKTGDCLGYVLAFEIDDGFIARYPVQKAGAPIHQEYWIPAADLTEFNRHIMGKIKVIESFQGKQT